MIEKVPDCRDRIMLLAGDLGRIFIFDQAKKHNISGEYGRFYVATGKSKTAWRI